MSSRWTLADASKQSPAMQTAVMADQQRATAARERIMAQAKKTIHAKPANRHGPLSSSQPESSLRHEPLGENQGKARYSGRVALGVKSFRVRLIDPDNLCPKYFIDGLRYAGVIADDTAKQVSLSVCQEKVKHKSDERTEITITPFPDA